MSEEEKSSIINLRSQYNDIFHFEEDNITFTDAVVDSISTSDDIPVNIKPYRLLFQQKMRQNQITQMLENKIIVPSNSPWNFPLIVVP